MSADGIWFIQVLSEEARANGIGMAPIATCISTAIQADAVNAPIASQSLAGRLPPVAETAIGVA
jgi:hypothetical protein